MKNYILKGEHISLSNDLNARYAGAVAEIANDRIIGRNIASHSFPNPYREEDVLDFFNKNREDGKNFFAIDFLIFSRDTPVGIVGLKDIEREDQNAHVGYWIGRKFWNNGYATEALSLIVKFSKDEVGLSRLYTDVLDYNLASLRVLMKNGFQVEGFKRNCFRMEDGFHSMFYVARLL